MRTRKTDPRDLSSSLPLNHTDFHILLSLCAGESHGYAIMQDVRQLTAGQMLMGPGTLYTTIRRLLETGLIEESDERPDPELDDQRRRYYRLTDLGRDLAQAEAARLQSLVQVVRARRLVKT